jgi:hypothetical protein
VHFVNILFPLFGWQWRIYVEPFKRTCCMFLPKANSDDIFYHFFLFLCKREKHAKNLDYNIVPWINFSLDLAELFCKQQKKKKNFFN